MDTPERYAAHLATYISSPTKIEALTRVEFGRAPPLHEIAGWRVAVERNMRRSSPSERVSDADDFRARDYIEVTPLPPPPKETGNPFLQGYRLTRAVAESVAKDFGITANDILGNRRWRLFIQARGVVVKLLIDRGAGFAELGRRMGRDHSTIIHRYRQFDTDVRHYPLMRSSYDRHLKLIEEADRESAEAACAA